MSTDDDKLARQERKFAKQDARDTDTGLALLCSTPQGRRALWWLLGECGTFTNPFNGNALETAFAAGRQSIGQAILERIEGPCPEAFIEATTENKEIEHGRNALRTSLDARLRGQRRDAGDTH